MGTSHFDSNGLCLARKGNDTHSHTPDARHEVRASASHYDVARTLRIQQLNHSARGVRHIRAGHRDSHRIAVIPEEDCQRRSHKRALLAQDRNRGDSSHRTNVQNQ